MPPIEDRAFMLTKPSGLGVPNTGDAMATADKIKVLRELRNMGPGHSFCYRCRKRGHTTVTFRNGRQ